MAKKHKKSSKKSSRGRSADRGGLSDMQDLWESREGWSGGEGTWKPPADEGYEATITDAIITKSKAGDRYVVYTHQMTSGEFKGKEFQDWQRLESQEGLNYIEGRLADLGIKTSDDINELGESLEAACGMEIRFDVYYKDEFFNMTAVEPLEGQPKKGKGKKEAAEEEDESTYTKKQIKAMDDDEMDALAEELGYDPDDYDTYEELADALIDDLGL